MDIFEPHYEKNFYASVQSDQGLCCLLPRSKISRLASCIAQLSLSCLQPQPQPLEDKFSHNMAHIIAIDWIITALCLAIFQIINKIQDTPKELTDEERAEKQVGFCSFMNKAIS